MKKIWDIIKDIALAPVAAVWFLANVWFRLDIPWNRLKAWRNNEKV